MVIEVIIVHERGVGDNVANNLQEMIKCGREIKPLFVKCFMPAVIRRLGWMG